jgi:quinol monooxygenase YgiN
MPNRKIVRIEYAIRPDVDVDEFVGHVNEFVAGLRTHDAGHRYTSYQHAEDPRQFVHIGDFAEDAVPALQAEQFFRRFTAFLRERCASGPQVTPLAQVATTR